MALHIRAPKVERMVRDLAAERGISLTEAVELAVANELTRAADFHEKVRRLQERVASYGKTGLKADKAFYDSLNDE